MVFGLPIAALAYPVDPVVAPPPFGVVTVTVADKSTSVAAGGSITIDVVSGSSASDGSSLRVSALSTAPAGRGSASFNASAGTVTYNAPSGISGNTVLTFTLTASTGATGTGTVTFVVTTGPVVEDPDKPTVSTFYQVGFVDGLDPNSGHGWNIGTMATSAKLADPVSQYLGFQQRVSGGKCFHIEAGSSAHRTTTWDTVCGGPTSQGIATPVNALSDILTASQASVHLHGSTRAGVRKEDGTTWVWLGLTFLPFGAAWAEVEKVIDGTNRAKLYMLGKRIRFIVDNFGKPYKQVIIRLMYEFNQDTALSLAGGKGFFQAAQAQGFTKTQALQKWKDFLNAGIQAFWDGYGYEVPMALSPALESTTMPWDFTMEELLVVRTIIACGSFHPIVKRVTTPLAAWECVMRTDQPKFFQPKKIIDAARNTGRVAAFLEHSVGLDSWEFFWNNTTRGLQHAHLAYKYFGQLLNDNADIMAFTGVLNTHMVQEDGTGYANAMRRPNNPSLANAARGAGRDPTTQELADWRALVRAYKFGWEAAATADAGSGTGIIYAHPGDAKRTWGFGKVLP